MWTGKGDLHKFEPGCIKCEICGSKPADSWDPYPEDFECIGNTWFCTECVVGEAYPPEESFEEII